MSSGDDFAAALKAQIEQSTMNQTQLAKRTGWSKSQISALATGRSSPKGREVVQELDTALNAGGMLLRRWLDAKRRDAQPEWLRRIDGVDEAATEIRIFQPFILPHVAQSPGYARSILRMGRPLDTSDQIEAAVERRMARSLRLLREDGPRISITVPHAVVRAAPDIAPDALEYLLRMPESCCVQVLPDGIHLAAATGAFRLISFAERLPVAFCEHAAGGCAGRPPARGGAVRCCGEPVASMGAGSGRITQEDRGDRMNEFHKSSYSTAGGECVEVAEGDATRVRDTRYRDGVTLTVPASEWRAFLADVDRF
ncbi:Scr1 family TA system antitoxin-like transcriptional regulator [Nocardiopsis mangrovi]|uniref:Scr1 family TA system antitoxin-like transcriptional regulator n=1 Tax=Nocardiopsis mangrovi TaxID=1179818 RepID=A0ABV9E1X5_9ACTN